MLVLSVLSCPQALAFPLCCCLDRCVQSLPSFRSPNPTHTFTWAPVVCAAIPEAQHGWQPSFSQLTICIAIPFQFLSTSGMTIVLVSSSSVTGHCSEVPRDAKASDRWPLSELGHTLSLKTYSMPLVLSLLATRASFFPVSSVPMRYCQGSFY